jgi:hypothetical protein
MSMPTCIKNQNAALSVGRQAEVNNTSWKIAIHPNSPTSNAVRARKSGHLRPHRRP